MRARALVLSCLIGAVALGFWEIAARGPKAKVVEIRGVGHAPTLMHQDQIALVRDFLMEGEAP